MTLKTRLFTGKVKSCICDKCGCEVNHSYTRFCKSCFDTPLQGKRLIDFKYDEFDKCNYCGEHITIETSKELCGNCTAALHPDSSHYWGSAIHTSDAARHCYQCSGAQVILINNKKGDYYYYKVGIRGPLTEPYRCSGFKSYESEVCTHEWIRILDLIEIDRRKAAEKYKELCRSGSGEVLQEVMGMVADDVQDLNERIAYGESYNWCWKCGLYYVPTGKPSFKLPVCGITASKYSGHEAVVINPYKGNDTIKCRCGQFFPGNEGDPCPRCNLKDTKVI